MITAKLIKATRGFGGDNYLYLGDDGREINVAIGWGLLQQSEIAIAVDGIIIWHENAVYDDWPKMIEQCKSAMRRVGYEPDSMLVLEGVGA